MTRRRQGYFNDLKYNEMMAASTLGTSSQGIALMPSEYHHASSNYLLYSSVQSMNTFNTSIYCKATFVDQCCEHDP